MSNVHVKYVCRMHNTIDDYKRITLGNPTNDLYKVHKLLYAKHVMVENLWWDLILYNIFSGEVLGIIKLVCTRQFYTDITGCLNIFLKWNMGMISILNI